MGKTFQIQRKQQVKRSRGRKNLGVNKDQKRPSCWQVPSEGEGRYTENLRGSGASWASSPEGTVSATQTFERYLSWKLTQVVCRLLTEIWLPNERMGLPWWLSGKESACNAGDLGLIPRLGRSPGEGNGNPLQCSCLENSMDRGAWRAIVHRIAKSLT